MPVDSRFWAFEASDAAIQYVRVYGENVYLENIVSVECFSLKWNFNFARKYNAEYMISAQFMNTMHNIAQTHTQTVAEVFGRKRVKRSADIEVMSLSNWTCVRDFDTWNEW